MSSEAVGSTGFELSKAYRPEEHEGRVWSAWLDAGAFRAEPLRVLCGEAAPYCVLIPPPNVTAALHLGHALNNTLQDVLVRAHRMKGFEALWMPGTDHAGIATQTVVDRRLKEAGKPGLAEHKAMEAAGEPGRERFVARVQAWKDEYEGRITEQLKLMGCSCDWDRQRFTMDEICARAVREAFFRLFKDGLIYRGKRLVNWDPVTQTALADDEVEMKEVQGHFYYLRYPLVHQSAPGDHRPVTWSELEAKGYPGAGEHPEDDHAWITIATTRPETYLGDTAVAVNPADPRAEAVRGLHVELPLIGRVIPIIEDDYVVLPAWVGRLSEPTSSEDDREAVGSDGRPARVDAKAEFATGFLKVTPAHDPNDWDIGQRHGLPVINVMAPDGSISDKHGWTDYDAHSGGHVFIGKSREEARQLVIREFQAHTINSQPLLEAIKDYTHSVGHSYRSHAAIEPYLSDQWYCRVTDDRLRGAAQRALRADQRTAASLEAWPESALNRSASNEPRPSGSGASTSYLITFSTYGTWLHGDQRGSADRSHNTPGTPYLAADHKRETDEAAAMSGAPVELDAQQRTIVANAIAQVCDHRGWHLGAVNVGTNHVHVVVSAPESPERVINDFKAYATRALRTAPRPATGGERTWTRHGSTRYLNTPESVEAALKYVLHEQGEDLGGTIDGAKLSDARRNDETPLPHGRGSSDGSLTFTPPRYARTYEGWHDNLRDWCISRQLWWGHRIPVWSRTRREDAATEAIERTVLDRIVYRDDGDAEFACVPAGCADAEARLEAIGFTQDPDVLDTWFSSALWPLSTLGWPAGDLPLVVAAQIDFDPSAVRGVYVKRVGTWKAFIGDAGAFSGELIDTLLVLRDGHKKHGGEQAISYQLFREQDLRDQGDKAQPLLRPDDIQAASDLVCAVAVKATSPVETRSGVVDVDRFLLAHGFQNTAGLLAAFNPTSVLCTAREIITLWVSRMVMFNRYFLGGSALRADSVDRTDAGSESRPTQGPVPFHDVFIHAMIQDGEGRKMSKSLGNGVDPLDIIHSHGADAMRFTLVEMTTQTQDVRMPVERDEATGRNTSPKFDLGRNFCNKLWNAARFAIGILGGSAPGGSALRADSSGGSALRADSSGGSALRADSAESRDAGSERRPTHGLSLADRWMLARLHAGIEEIDQALREYQFSAYAKALYDLVRRDFCDWYLEAIKPTARENPAQRAVLRSVLDALLRLLHPVIPFITEAIFEKIRDLPAAGVDGVTLPPPRKGGVLATAGWPAVDPSLADADAVARFERVRSLVDTVRQVRSQHQVNPRRRITLHVSAALRTEIAESEGLVEALAGVDGVTTEAPAGPSAVFTFDGVEHRAADLADAVDGAAERERLERQVADLDRRRAGLAGRLSNPGYADRAPAHLVQQTRDELAQVEADLRATRSALGERA